MAITKTEILEVLAENKAEVESKLTALLADEDLYNDDDSDNVQVQVQLWNYIIALAVNNPKAKEWVEDNL
tara:strand:- start:445 stop:654 length:210 start_codon:yes stop_codon:yes gene_type:complete